MKSCSKLLPWILILGMAVFCAARARADALSEYEKARNSYAAGNYQEAEQRFEQLLRVGRIEQLPSTKMRNQASVYRVACLLALGRNDEADQHIEGLLRQHPDIAPDPVLFPTAVLDRFSDIRAKIRQELEAQARKRATAERKRREHLALKRKKERERVKKLEQMASQQICVHHHSRWVAAIPFGVGQFQNGQDVMGWMFLGTEAALAVGTVVTGGIYQALESKGQQPNVDPHDLNARLSDMRLYNRVMFGVLVGTALGGIAHAQLTFVPSKTTVKPRVLPHELKMVPDAQVERGGVVVRLRGVF